VQDNSENRRAVLLDNERQTVLFMNCH